MDDQLPLREATKTWFAVSLQTFGGPAGQIAVMQHTLVDEKRWLSQERFLHALNYCMLLPGPEAQQLAIYTGWLLNGTAGGLIAGTLFVLPGVLAMLALSALYVGAGSTAVVTGLFAGLAPAVIAIVIHAVHRVAKRALRGRALVGIAIAAFVALTAFRVPFPLVIAAAGAAGWIMGRGTPAASGDDVEAEARRPHRPARRTAAIVIGGLALWFAPVAGAAALFGRSSVFVEQGLFFSGAAVVTFGGAYAVLAYVAHQAVVVHGWLHAGEMVRGLALAETTPGPLIMVVQFVAFVGAFRDPGPLDPWVAAVVASLLVTWVTFVPCFLFIFLGAPYVERLRSNRHWTSALTGITAAVVGVIANLGVFFALHHLFHRAHAVVRGPVNLDVPVLTSWSPTAFALTAMALTLIFVMRWSPLRTMGLCAAVGLATTLF